MNQTNNVYIQGTVVEEHHMLRDNQREVVFNDILSFIDDPDGPLPSQAPPLLPIVQANR